MRVDKYLEKADKRLRQAEKELREIGKDKSEKDLAGEAAIFFSHLYKAAQDFVREIDSWMPDREVTDFIGRDRYIGGFGSLADVRTYVHRLMAEAKSKFEYFKKKYEEATQ